MPRYRTVPREIEAERITPENIARVAEWCRGKHIGTRLPPPEQSILINTNNGEVQAEVGVWIIKGLSDFYPCDNETFQKSYEEVKDAASN